MHKPDNFLGPSRKTRRFAYMPEQKSGGMQRDPKTKVFCDDGRTVSKARGQGRKGERTMRFTVGNRYFCRASGVLDARWFWCWIEPRDGLLSYRPYYGSYMVVIDSLCWEGRQGQDNMQAGGQSGRRAPLPGLMDCEYTVCRKLRHKETQVPLGGLELAVCRFRL